MAPGADEQLNSDPPQDHRLPDDLVDGRPVPAEGGRPEVILLEAISRGRV